MEPEISVIIPIYDTERYLSRCLDSIMGQTFDNLEIICVNDGSPDNCLTILKEYAAKDRRFKIIDKPNGGIASARNAGLEIAQGKYISFIDSDDWIESDTYERAIKYMTGDVDLVTWGYKEITENSNGDLKIKHCHETKLLNEFNAESDSLLAITWMVWNKLFKKSIIKHCEINFPEDILYEDVYFCWVYIARTRKIFGIKELCHNYLVRERSCMDIRRRRKSNKVIDTLLNFKAVYEYYRKNGLLKDYGAFLVECLFITFKGDFQKCLVENEAFVLDTVSRFATEMDFGEAGNRDIRIQNIRAGQYSDFEFYRKRRRRNFLRRIWYNMYKKHVKTYKETC